jgi:hypothetical protein
VKLGVQPQGQIVPPLVVRDADRCWMTCTPWWTSGAKSDASDAHVLAEIFRLDRAHHRLMAGDLELSEAVKVLARTHQTMIWDRQPAVLRLRSCLRDFFPAALAAFPDFDRIGCAGAARTCPRPGPSCCAVPGERHRGADPRPTP